MDDHRAFAAAAETGLADLRTLALPSPDPTGTAQSHRKALAGRADTELAERLRQVGRLPDAVDAFLHSHWRQYLVDCLERHGAEASPWRQALATVDALLWSLGPKDGSARQRLTDLRPRMTRRLRQGMDQVGVSMFEQEAFLETLDAILDRAQDGQPVWDWQEDSAIEALIGADVPIAPSVSAVSVIELDAPPAPVRLVAVNENKVVADLQDGLAEEESEAGPLEEIVSLNDLADELELEEPVLLELPPAPEEQADADIADLEDVLAPDVGVLEEPAPAPATDDLPLDAPGESNSESDFESGVESGAPTDAAGGSAMGKLEALLRRRGLKATAQVEEVVVTDRGARG